MEIEKTSKNDVSVLKEKLNSAIYDLTNDNELIKYVDLNCLEDGWKFLPRYIIKLFSANTELFTLISQKSRKLTGEEDPNVICLI